MSSFLRRPFGAALSPDVHHIVIPGFIATNVGGCSRAFVIREGVSPMNRRSTDPQFELNWVAIGSYTAAIAVSLAVWFGVVVAVQHAVR
jgi:hypothetical protein